MITIYVQKTQARAELDAPVTSGSVGREVQFQFSDDWNGLAKTAVFETNNYKETATVPVSGTLAIPEDVLAYPGFQLRIGVIGKTAGDATVIPTVYADCGMIKPGASTAPVSTPLTPSQFEQLQAQIDELREQSVGGDGLSTTEKTLLLSLFKNAEYTADMSATIAQLETLWSGGDEPDEPVTPDVTLSSISATYSGGSVPVGTAASSLTGVNVTAHYSDGSTATVTGYTLSGTIVEGSNTITVSYGGKTTTVTVVGVASTDTDIALGPVTSVAVVMWIGAAASNQSVEYANNVDVVDGAVVFINGSIETFYKNASGNTNNYDILLGKYVKDPNGNIYYINPDSTYSHTTNPSGVVKESISYQKAQLVSVI